MERDSSLESTLWARILRFKKWIEGQLNSTSGGSQAVRQSGNQAIGQSAFTLIEVMVVLIIITGVAVLGLPRIGSHTNELKATIRKLSVLGKQLQVHSRLEHKTYRLAFHLSKDKPHSFWVESAPGYVSESADEEEDDEREEDDEKKAQTFNTFQPDTSILKKPISLPKPLLFKDIELEDRVNKEGKVYVHFFPQGIIEETAIHLSDGDELNWTISYHSLTGKGHIISRHLPLKALRNSQ